LRQVELATAGYSYEAFWSYTRFDDEHDGQWLTSLREAVVSEVRARSGKKIEIFQDKDGIDWGERWGDKLVDSADAAIFLIPVITSAYFSSEACRKELMQFVTREDNSGFRESILPLYYIDAIQLRDDFGRKSDLLAREIAAHNYIDIRGFRHRDIHSYEVKQKITEIAIALLERLSSHARWQLQSKELQAEFTVPRSGAHMPRKALLLGYRHNVPESIHLWVVVEAGTIYHPQCDLPPGNGPFEASATIGRPNDDIYSRA